MKVNSFQIDEALQLKPLSLEELSEARTKADARIWIDLQEFERSEFEDWLDKLEVKGLSRQLCLEARNRAGFYPLKNEILLIIPFLSKANASEQRKVDYIAFLCRETLLLTAHRTSILMPQRRAEIQESHEWLADRSISALVSALMNDLSQKCVDSTAELKGLILALEERMDRDPNAVEAEEILVIRSKLLDVGSVVGDQSNVVRWLVVTQTSRS